MPTYSIHADLSGPIPDGAAPHIVRDFSERATERLAETAADWIRIDANAMDRSGRGGTGRAAAGVTVSSRSAMAFAGGGGVERVVFGEMIRGQVWWPWLEGTSQRNRSTRFKGYHTFRNNSRKLDEHLQEIIRPLVEDMVRQLGGA
jgi:hypothetical protein